MNFALFYVIFQYKNASTEEGQTKVAAVYWIILHAAAV